MRIGFAIASYTNTEELSALIEELNTDLNEPAIAIHHDFSQADLSRALLPANARVVEDWQPTRWGEWSLVEAE